MSRSVPLPAIAVALSATEALSDGIEESLGRLIDHVLDAPDWATRLMYIDASIPADPADRRAGVEAQSRFITAMLEPLGERDIASIEAAIAYRVSWHAGWRDSAKRYLEPHGEDIIPLLEAHPGIGVFVGQFLALEGTHL